MVVVKDRSYLVTCRVELGDFFGVPAADAFVELREPDTFDSNQLHAATKSAQETGDSGPTIAAFRALLPKLVVDHSLYRSETEKLSSDEVAALIIDKMAIFERVVTAYSKNVLFTLGKQSE